MCKSKIRNLLTLLAVVTAVYFCSISANAETFEAGGIFYKTTSAGEVEVTRSPNIEGYAFDVVIPETVTHEGETFKVTAIGENAFSQNYYLISVNISKTVKVIKENAFSECNTLIFVTFASSSGLEEIGESAFYGCKAIDSVTLPSSLKIIGANAFAVCTKLKDVSFFTPVSVEYIGDFAFGNTRWDSILRENGEEVYIGKVLYHYAGDANTDTYSVKPGTKSIAGRAFYENEILKTLDIPASVVNIGDYLFQTNDNLTDVNFEDANTLENVTSLSFARTAWFDTKPDGEVYLGKILVSYKGYVPEGGTIKVKDGTVKIARQALAEQTGLESITIPNSVKVIEKRAFTGCYSLKSVVLPDGLKELSRHLFERCLSLNDLKIPGSVEVIKEKAIGACRSLKNIYIPANVREIEDGAFADVKLDEIAVAEKNRNYCTVDGILYTGDKKKLIAYPSKGPAEFVIPDSIEVSRLALSSTAMLKSVTVPASFTEISDKMFSGCSSLENVVFESPSRIKSIGIMAFSGCSSLKSISLPDSLEFIGESAFQDCSSLADITFPESLRSIFNTYTFVFGNTAWANNQPKGVVYAGNMAYYYKGEKPETIEIKEGTKLINEYFTGNYKTYNIKSVKLPGSIEYIGDCAFFDLPNLTNIEGGDNAALGYGVFDDTPWWGNQVNEDFIYFGKSIVNAPSAPAKIDVKVKEGTEFINFRYRNRCLLPSLSLPQSIKSVAGRGFENLQVDKYIEIDKNVPPELEGNPRFHPYMLEFCILRVPEAAVDTYKKAPYWRLFHNIVGDPELSGVEAVEPADNLRVFADGENIVVKGVEEGTAVEVFNLNGQKIYGGVETLISVPAKGIYIVRIEDKAYKVAM